MLNQWLKLSSKLSFVHLRCAGVATEKGSKQLSPSVMTREVEYPQGMVQSHLVLAHDLHPLLLLPSPPLKTKIKRKLEMLLLDWCFLGRVTLKLYGQMARRQPLQSLAEGYNLVVQCLVHQLGVNISCGLSHVQLCSHAGQHVGVFEVLGSWHM